MNTTIASDEFRSTLDAAVEAGVIRSNSYLSMEDVQALSDAGYGRTIVLVRTRSGEGDGRHLMYVDQLLDWQRFPNRCVKDFDNNVRFVYKEVRDVLGARI